MVTILRHILTMAYFARWTKCIINGLTSNHWRHYRNASNQMHKLTADIEPTCWRQIITKHTRRIFTLNELRLPNAASYTCPQPDFRGPRPAGWSKGRLTCPWTKLIEVNRVPAKNKFKYVPRRTVVTKRETVIKESDWRKHKNWREEDKNRHRKAKGPRLLRF